MSMTWKPFDRIGVAIYRYDPEQSKGKHRLSINIGELLHIQEECKYWFYGYSTNSIDDRFGIFPKSHVVIQEDFIPSGGDGRIGFEQETILILHEWNRIIKKNLINGESEKYIKIQDLIFDIIEKHQILKSGKLTSTEMKKLKSELIDKIDLGNKYLDLDLIIRNQDGMVLNPFDISILSYFNFHWNKSQLLKSFFRTSTDSGDSTKQELTFKYSNYSQDKYECSTTSSQDYNICYNFCVTLLNFICVIKQDMIIHMAIYDVDLANSPRLITENYIVKWNKTGLVRELDKINNIRVVFTDFNPNDLFGQTSKRLFLICQVIRVGTMHIESEKSWRMAHPSANERRVINVEELKRPCGVAVYDLSKLMSKNHNYDEANETFVPLVQYSEKDSLDSLLRKVIRDVRDSKEICNKTQGFVISIKLFSSFKMQMLDKYRLYYAQYPSFVARKIGFRDIILPEDVRNDIYLTLVSGEFHKGSKKSERNIEVTVKILDENGNVINDCLCVDSHNATDSVYRSVVYYHEDKPKWMETIKICLPIEKINTAHLKFIFKHRSSNENKDKNEKPFAISFLRLMNQNGTTLKNGFYQPFVYKCEPRKYNEYDNSYLMLPSLEKDNKQKFSSSSSIPTTANNIYVHNPRDIFTISLTVCSTKLTQNIKILGLLNWREQKESLKTILTNVQQLEGSEIMKFLHDVLDALFEIWMDPYTSSQYYRQIFDSLVYIIKHLLQEKYIHFQEILNEYIDKHFSATLIHDHLIKCFKYYIENPDSSLSYQTVTSMEFIFKLIIRSRYLYVILNDDKNREEFEQSLDELFELFTGLMDSPNEFNDSTLNENIIKVKLGILKYFPKIIENVLKIFDPKKLTYRIIRLISNIPVTEFSVQKLACIHEIVESRLFKDYAECRRKLLPVINVHLQTALIMVVEENQYHNEKLEKCLAIINDSLETLSSKDKTSIKHDILDMVQILLQPMIETLLWIPHKQNENIYKHKMWTLIIALLYQMSDYHYNEYLSKLRNNRELEMFLKDLLKTFDIATTQQMIYPKDWSDLNFTQNVVLLKAMTRIINYSKENVHFYEYDIKLWKQLFLTAIKYITQKSLSLETFSIRKRKRLEKSYHSGKDMRLEMVALIRSLWYNLANNKHSFIPSLIGPLLEAALLPVDGIRKDIIVIFFDMFYSCMEKASIFRDEMLTQLDSLVTVGKGDSGFQKLLTNVFLESSENYTKEMKETFENFVQEISEQTEKLLIYRDVQNLDNYEVIMSSIKELFDFYERIGRRELYIRYLYKLYDLHIKCENYNEAAYTLAKHSILLEWSDKPLEELLRTERYSDYQSHRELKEKLYSEIIEDFNKGQLWEAGIIYCKKLIHQYEEEIFDYVKLSDLFEKMSSFYKLIISSVRIEPEYFHVTYYGKGFPVFFQNKSFIYRGKSYERLFEFTKRLQNQFPNAKLLDKLDVTESEIINSNDQHLSIYRVDPKVMEDVKQKFLKTLVDERIVKYYQYNEINEFIFSRKLIKDNNNKVSNEFACMWIERSEYKTAFCLPGILCGAEIVHKMTYQLNPLQNAIDTMEKMNEKTRTIIYRYLLDEENANPLHNLLMHIKGIVSSDVQGGVSKYEEAFFNDEDNSQQEQDQGYDQTDIDKLKTLIADQIPLLDLAIKIADQKQRKQHSIHQSMDGLYQYIVESFEKMRDDVERKYGKSQLPVEMKKILDNHYKMQKLAAATTLINIPDDSRNSMDGNLTLTKRSFFSRSNTNTGNTLTSTLRFRKKESRRSNMDLSTSSTNNNTTSVYSSNVNISQTHWYTESNKKSSSNISNQIVNYSDSSPNTETSSINSETTKSSRISSRPSSGHFSRASIQSQLSFFCPQSTSSMSLDEDQDEVPPPLPKKKISIDMSPVDKPNSRIRSNSTNFRS